MKPEDIHLTDILRILIGEVPFSFFIEVIFRVIFVFLLLVISMRLLGRRMAGLLDMHELSLLVALGAAVGVPLQSPDRGILPALLIALLVVGLQKLIFLLGYKFKKIEFLVHGDIKVLIEDGILKLPHLRKVLITRERLFGSLRSKGIKNLGEVQRFYMETSGSFTIIKNNTTQPGLSIIPEYDKEFIHMTQKKVENRYACSACGNIQNSSSTPKEKCEICNNRQWEEAYL